MRIALANLPFPANADDAIALVERGVREAAVAGARVVCFPENFAPGYRTRANGVAAPDEAYLERARSATARAAAVHGISVILGTERIVDGAHRITAAVFDDGGALAGFQDKVQLDPSEEDRWSPGTERAVFTAGPLTFGIVICHEGWRYPETVRWAARRGAQVVFHPQYHAAEPGAFRPTSYGDPANSFHEKAALCRAAENTCWFATVNYAGEGSPTTSAVVAPDGTLHAWQPYGVAGVLVADVDLVAATGSLARRLRTTP